MRAMRAWLDRPFGWFTFVLAEYVVAVAVLRGLAAVLPVDLPRAFGVAVLVALVAGLLAFNLWLRRRLADADRDR
jgi:ABC-type antimicrobial peptide transport system permease subunit